MEKEASLSAGGEQGSPAPETYSRLGPAARWAPLAQLVEQLTLNQWVPGSSP